MKIKSKTSKTQPYDKVMVVAHPDDELIFGGSLLITQKKWHVICITNMDNKSRFKEFTGLMKELKVSYEMFDHYDDYDDDYMDDELQEHLLEYFSKNKKKLKMIVTHNNRGEYGHSQHKGVSKMMTNIVKSLGIKGKLHYFGKGTKKLPAEIIKRKYELMAKYYPSQYQVLDRLKIHDYIEKEKVKIVTSLSK
jgi:LmbE family N-acetylglucosaminyl deacetylase